MVLMMEPSQQQIHPVQGGQHPVSSNNSSGGPSSLMGMSSPASGSLSASNSNNNLAAASGNQGNMPSPQSVGREFVRQYYTLLNQAPLHLPR